MHGNTKNHTVVVLPENSDDDGEENMNWTKFKNVKKDRNKLNTYINQLADLLPSSSAQSKKLDKVTKLSETVNFIRRQNDDFKHGNPDVLTQPDFRWHMSDLQSTCVEFTSRQTLHGKFLFLDPECVSVIGYLPHEMVGKMIYEYIHVDDFESVYNSFEKLFENGECETEPYRILTKGCQWISIKTTSSIFYNQWNNKPECVRSTHSLVVIDKPLRERSIEDDDYVTNRDVKRSAEKVLKILLECYEL